MGNPLFIEEGKVVLRVGVSPAPSATRSQYAWSAELVVSSLDDAFATIDRFREWGHKHNGDLLQDAREDVASALESLQHYIDRPQDFKIEVVQGKKEG